MAKVRAPLFSFGASGQIAKSLVYFPWKGVNAIRSYVVPANPNTAAQQTQRGYMTAAVAAWHTMAYTAADVVAWNRYAGTLAKIMTGFNAMVRIAIAIFAAPSAWRTISDVQVDTPTVNGFDVDVENSIPGYSIRARIGTRRTHFPVTQALVDDGDNTYSLTWAGGVTDQDYYVYLEVQIIAWERCTGIYHVRTA